MAWMWMSFAGLVDGKPTNLGCCIVEIPEAASEAGGMESATACVRASREAGCNPGGEVLMHRLGRVPPEDFRNRLMPAVEAMRVAADSIFWTEEAARAPHVKPGGST